MDAESKKWCEECGKGIIDDVYYFTETRGQIWTGKFFIWGEVETDEVCKTCYKKLNKRRNKMIKWLGWTTVLIILVFVVIPITILIIQTNKN